MTKLFDGLDVLTGTIAAILLLPSACYSQGSFDGLGNLPGNKIYSLANDVSADGGTVVGWSYSTLGKEAFIWDASNGMQGLGDLPGGRFRSESHGISADGSVVVGDGMSALSGGASEAFILDTATGLMNGLGDLPGGVFSSRARDVSADGNCVVGTGDRSRIREAFIWTAAGGMQGLGGLPGPGISGSSSEGLGVSGDGSVVVGTSTSFNGREAFIWDASSGMQGLGDLPGGSFYSRALAVSADGSVVAGQGTSKYGPEAFILDVAGGMLGLGDLPGGDFNSQANDVSADGTIVVGRGVTQRGTEAFIWDAANGMRNLRAALSVDYGVPKSAIKGWTLLEARAVSDDGRVIVGYGLNPGKRYEAWRVELGSDNHGPEVTCPGETMAECVNGGANILVTAEVFDADGDPLDVSWQVTDPDGNTSIIHETVTFSDPPTPVTIELIDPHVTPAGFFFPHGSSRVDVTVSDGIAYTLACSPISVTVRDTEAPIVVTLMELVEVGNDPRECVATVDLDSPDSPYAPVFADLCSPNITADHDAPPVFPVGETLVNWTVSDGNGNTLSISQTILVSDIEAPIVHVPPDVVVGHDPGDCVASMVELWFPEPEDNCGGTDISNNAPSVFPLGETIVEWLVSDFAGNTTIVNQLVTVTNETPVADAGPDLVQECNGASGEVLTLDGTGSWDLDVGDMLSFHWDAVDVTFDDSSSPTPTATFPHGSTTVQLTVSDQCGAESTTDLLVIVQDTTAPQIQAAVVDRSVLFPPNHKLIPVALDLLVSDTCTAPEDLLLVCQVESNEPDDELGDGAFTGDVNLSDGFTESVEVLLDYNSATGRWEGELLLRAERNGGGDGRKYSIRCLAMDDSGNATSATVCVTVPHDRRGGKK